MWKCERLTQIWRLIFRKKHLELVVLTLTLPIPNKQKTNPFCETNMVLSLPLVMIKIMIQKSFKKCCHFCTGILILFLTETLFSIQLHCTVADCAMILHPFFFYKLKLRIFHVYFMIFFYFFSLLYTWEVFIENMNLGNILDYEEATEKLCVIPPPRVRDRQTWEFGLKHTFLKFFN